jgi:hypothetical protein
MKELSSIGKLDMVLKFLAVDPKALAYISDANIFSELKKVNDGLKNQNDFGSELIRILKKLIKDGYVDRIDIESNHYPIDVKNPHTIAHYLITFEGKVFYDFGGYNEKIKEDKAGDKRISDLEKSQAKMAKAQFRINLTIAVAAIIATIYYSIEICKFSF